MSLRTVKLLSPGQSVSGLSYYKQWFEEAWCGAGGGVVAPQFKWPHFLKVVLGRAWPGFSFSRRSRLLTVSSGRVESVAWPGLLTNEIVPMLWDVWPHNVPPLVKFVKRNKVRLIFCTSSQTVERLRGLLPETRVVWVPEGIKVAAYPCGSKLKDRLVDIVSYGRQMRSVVDLLRDYARDKQIKALFRSGKAHLFANFEELTAGLRSSKVTICYPQSITHPEYAKGLETLTQRYWEAMLSGTLLAGHAPRELVEVCGYNPVIELGESPCKILDEVLLHIDEWQALADKNRKCAEEIGGWDKRMPMIMEALECTSRC